jgi:predicted ATPase
MLATILPELAERLDDMPMVGALPAEQARLRPFDAVGKFLAAIAAWRPVLLILGGLRWADPATLDLLVDWHRIVAVGACSSLGTP